MRKRKVVLGPVPVSGSFELACNKLSCYKQFETDDVRNTGCRLFMVRSVDGVVFTECVRCGSVRSLGALQRIK